MHSPWIVLGWLMCLVVALALVATPIFMIVLLRQRRAAMRRHAAWLDERDASRQVRGQRRP